MDSNSNSNTDSGVVHREMGSGGQVATCRHSISSNRNGEADPRTAAQINRQLLLCSNSYMGRATQQMQTLPHVYGPN